MSSVPPEAAAVPDTATVVMGERWAGYEKSWVRVRVFWSEE